MKAILLLFLIFSISCNTTTEKIKCIIQNKNIFNEIIGVIESIQKKEIVDIIGKIIEAFFKIKEEVEHCIYDEIDEPILKAGCRYEEQFKNCQLYSCEYLDEFDCMEYCYHKYC